MATLTTLGEVADTGVHSEAAMPEEGVPYFRVQRESFHTSRKSPAIPRQSLAAAIQRCRCRPTLRKAFSSATAALLMYQACIS